MYDNALSLERSLISKVVYAGQVERTMGVPRGRTLSF